MCRLHCVGQLGGGAAEGESALGTLQAGEHCGSLCFLLLIFDAVWPGQAKM